MTNRILPTSPDPIPKEYQKMQWAVVAHTVGEPMDWVNGNTYPVNASRIQYENGWVYDFTRVPDSSPWWHVDD